MKTYDDANEKNRKVNTWPLPGTEAADLVKTDYKIMVDGNLLSTSGFQVFYQGWTQNFTAEKRKQMYVCMVECKNTIVVPECVELTILQYKETDNFVSAFKRLKNMGTWLFLTNDEKKAESAVKASRESGLYLRVYRLDSEGKLRNCRPLVKKEDHRERQALSYVNAFSLPGQMHPIQRRERKKQTVPGKGDVVFSSDKQQLILKDEFLSNPQSITYQTDRVGVQAKIYDVRWLQLSYFEDKVKKMLEKPLQCEGICWPIDLLYDADGEFVGILVPKAEGYQLKQQLMSQYGLETNFPKWNRRQLTHLTKVILEKIVYLQNRNILFGIVNPDTIFVKDEDHVYFADMDTYQIEGYPILLNEKFMRAPELQDKDEEICLYTKQQDNYEIAVLVFMLLMPGKFPYNKGINQDISESIKNMNFAFRYRNKGEEHGAREYFGLWRFAWSHLGNDLKQAFYYTFQKGQAYSAPEQRKNAQFWKGKVEQLERELVNPFDQESLRIFPRTFKRFAGMRTIRCVKCGIEHPYFYYKYPEKEICNSCLGKPSDQNFVCRSCGKSYYYDFGTLFKYENLIETKQFEMPTHCPYCRSDKIKCVSCGKMVPTYRINHSGKCIDCAKAARRM